MSNSPRIILIAMASRPYVEMAVDAGYQVIAIDAFADGDLKKVAEEVHQLPIERGVFERDALEQLLQQLDYTGVVAACYGAGFEDAPELIELLGQYVTVFGNTAATVSACKDIKQFTNFCEKHAFLYPPISEVMPSDCNGWLVKQEAGSGGTHVQYLTAETALMDGEYCQQFQKGTPVSCLFLSNGTDACIVGLNEQWCDASTHSPFRYGGAVSHLDVEKVIEQKMQDFLQLAVKHFNLIGLNSCDAILHNNELYFLELNPRLSATAGLYESAESHLFAHHIQSCQHKALPVFNPLKTSKAHQVKYATHDCSIINDEWPEWVSDLPALKETILRERPMFTVYGSAESGQLAKQLVNARAASIF